MSESNKEPAVEVTGVVREAVRGAFRVQLENSEHIILCHLGGKMRKNYIKVVAGDRVVVEVSPYDFTKGRITYRDRG